MKKFYLLLFIILCLLLSSCNSQTNSSQDLPSNLTLNQAINLAYSDALDWNKKAKLIDATSIDSDEEQTGGDGKRRYWNITFGVPDTNDLFLVNIHDAKINEHAEFPNEGEVRTENYFVKDLSDIKYDSPELLEKAKEITELYPGDVFAKGYNFGLTTDPEKNLVLIKIVGWDEERKNMKYVLFNGENGELYDEFEREQYQ
ncbi:hypothetical protein [Oceanobacillus neutriphilus]|uniref:PepSY domain-containing protein n=1 Tax=Oceanobacillus neutriphilus TaxID=531815 RepID=A0ABQ2NSK1_9BACI|nr:hypothetical protein [Oceanobacillus neutriphilus]GGP08881.1 hypothetical protein GCM10011346_10970 [Oceanobacillus neutriphilus]